MSNLLVFGTAKPINSRQNDSPNQLTWEIRDFKTCAHKAKVKQKNKNSYFTSNSFTLKHNYEHNFNFLCYPAGRSGSSKIIIGIVLNNTDNFETVRLKWRMSETNFVSSDQNDSNDDTCGWSTEIQIDKRFHKTSYKTTNTVLKNIVTDFQIFCEIEILDDTKSETPYKMYEVMAINYFDNLFRTGNISDDSSDAILVAHLDDTEFKVNKEVLSSHSSVFETTFKQAPINGKYSIDDIDGPNLNALLQYIYTGRTKFVNLETLGNMANRFGMYQLEISCLRWENSQDLLNVNSTNWDIYDTLKDTGDCKFNPKVVEQRKTHLRRMVELYNKYNEGQNAENSNNSDNKDIITSNYTYVAQNYLPEFRWLIDKVFPFDESRKYAKILHDFFVIQNQSKFSNDIVYFLLNPLTLNDLPDKANAIFDDFHFGAKDGNFLVTLDQEWLPSFIRSIFYVGIGQPDRPLNHFKDAYKVHSLKASSNAQRESDQIEAETDFPNETAKLKLINDILDKENGEVIVLIAFNGLTKNETQTIEAIIIDAIKPNITNINDGSYTMNLDDHQRTLLAPHFIYKAFLTFLETGGQRVNRDSNKVEFRPKDKSKPEPGLPHSETNVVNSELTDQIKSLNLEN